MGRRRAFGRAPRLPGQPADSVETLLSSGEVRRKAAAGVLLVGLRSVAIRGLGLVGSLVLARLLVPEDFGILAFGQTLIVFGAFFSDAGIAAGLVRRTKAPERHELQTVLGFQMLVSTVLILAVAAVAAPTGRAGQVASVMVASVFLSSCRVPASLVLERRLDYRSLASVEVLEGLVFVAWSITAVALGAGVWGVASAHLARALVGTALMIRRSPVRVLRPRLEVGVVRELLGYGLVVQAGGLVNLIRAQGINLTTAALAGLPVLGLFSLADRIMQLPWLVFESMLRVTFPAMARLVSAGADARQDLERGLRLLTVSAGPLLALVAATAPVLVPFLFGTRWTESAEAVPLIALGLLVAGPVIAMGNGYLYAVGDARKVLTANAVHAAVWFAVAVPTLPSFGVTAVGAGLCLGLSAEGLLLARAVRQRTGLRCYRITGMPTVAVVLAGAAGHQLARGLAPSLGSLVLVGLVTAALLAVALLITGRHAVLDAVALLRRLAARAEETGAAAPAAAHPVEPADPADGGRAPSSGRG